MSFHPEAIEASQQDALRRLGPVVTKHGFYLAGGTALALHFGHRLSVDFDWFTHQQMAEPLRLAQDLRGEGLNFTTGQVAPGTLYGEVAGVRISFFEYRYPLLQPLVEWPKFGCSLVSPDDLACMKLSAIAQRGARKDFIDLYVLGTRHKPLPTLLALYRQKYAVDDIAHLLYALVYFDEAETEPMPRLLWDFDWQTVKDTVRAWVRQVAG